MTVVLVNDDSIFVGRERHEFRVINLNVTAVRQNDFERAEWRRAIEFFDFLEGHTQIIALAAADSISQARYGIGFDQRLGLSYGAGDVCGFAGACFTGVLRSLFRPNKSPMSKKLM
jgi:hypothetical protein